MTDVRRPFGRVLTAMVTPMLPTGELDLLAAQKLAKHLVDHGSDGLVLSGTTGEAPTTHAPDKVDLIAAVREAVGSDVTILTGIGSNDTAHAVRMASTGSDAGVDGLLLLTPYYSKPSQAGVLAHFHAVLDATELPVMLYDIPGRTGLAIADETYDAIASHEQVVAVKDATGSVAPTKGRIERTGLAWYSGDDPLTLDFLRAGAVGVVSVASHVVGTQIAGLIAAHEAGQHEHADDLNQAITAAAEVIFGLGPAAATAKAAMQRAGVLDSRQTRLPILPLSDDEYAVLDQRLRAAGVL